MTQPYGATPDDWVNFDLCLGLTEDLLPVVSRPGAPISPDSKLRALGKTPSQYNARREVVGIARWTERRTSGRDIDAWMLEPDYGICLQTRQIRAFDIDVEDEEEAGAISAQLEALGLPCRRRGNSSKRLFAFWLPGELPKRSFRTQHGLVEMLGTGQQMIVAGTHPSGARYEWDGGVPDAFPELTPAQLEDVWSALVERFAVAKPTGGTIRRRGEDLAVDDPVAVWLLDKKLVLDGSSAGELFVACPWAAEHTSESGVTEAAWLSAGTNGYSEGNFRCLHAHCHGRGRDQFLQAVGYVADSFETLPEQTDEEQEPVESTAIVLDPKSSIGQARAFVEHAFTQDGHPTLIRTAGTWYQHLGPCYGMRDEEQIRSAAWRFLAQAWKQVKDARVRFDPTRNQVVGAVDALRSIVEVEAPSTPAWLDKRDSATDYLPLADGLLHIPSRKLLPHTSLFFGVNALPFSWGDGDTDATEWLRFLASVWPDDPQSINTLQEMFGYLLTADTSQQKMFFIVGPKRSGKGTIARVLTQLVGQPNVASPTLNSLTTQFGLEPLIGKLAATIPDARLGGPGVNMHAIVEKLLMLSGEDDITVDRKNKVAWTGRLTARVVIMSNEVPRLGDSAGALPSRFVVLSMDQSFYGREDLRLQDRLSAELPAILRWALIGRDRLKARGYFVQPETGRDELDELYELGNPVLGFVEECCEIDPDGLESVKTLFNAWREWANRSGHHPGAASGFSRALRSAFPKVRKRKIDGSTRGLAGIRIKSQFRDPFDPSARLVPANDVDRLDRLDDMDSTKSKDHVRETG